MCSKKVTGDKYVLNAWPISVLIHWTSLQTLEQAAGSSGATGVSRRMVTDRYSLVLSANPDTMAHTPNQTTMNQPFSSIPKLERILQPPQ